MDIFDEKWASWFSDKRPWDHKIEIKPGFELESFKNYNLTPAEQDELDKFLKGKDIYKNLNHQWPHHFSLSKRKMANFDLARITNFYPLPLISEIMYKLKGTKYFTKLDVQWGYNNIRIREGDEWKAAFKMNRGLFEPTVMFFDMCNSLANFQSMMDSIFIKEIEDGVTIAYMDDILICVTTLELLEKYMKQILQKLWDHNLFLKAKKCEFGKTKLEYLGLIVEAGKLSMDLVKVKGFADWPIPKSVKEVQSFLGFGNFYRKFIVKFSTLAVPLNNLLKKDTPFEWTDNAQHSFDELKQRLT